MPRTLCWCCDCVYLKSLLLVRGRLLTLDAKQPSLPLGGRGMVSGDALIHGDTTRHQITPCTSDRQTDRQSDRQRDAEGGKGRQRVNCIDRERGRESIQNQFNAINLTTQLRCSMLDLFVCYFCCLKSIARMYYTQLSQDWAVSFLLIYWSARCLGKSLYISINFCQQAHGTSILNLLFWLFVMAQVSATGQLCATPPEFHTRNALSLSNVCPILWRIIHQITSGDP